MLHTRRGLPRDNEAMKTFEDIVSGNTPCHKVWEDDNHLAFLNPRPILRGHVIVIPKKLSSYVFEIPAAEYHALWESARIVAEILRERLRCERVCLAVVGWEVRHTHIHLVPTNRSGEFPSLPGREASAEDLGHVAAELSRRRVGSMLPDDRGTSKRA
jgi:histidine triad (HIT) family protein